MMQQNHALDDRVAERLCGNLVDRGVGVSFRCLWAFWRGIIFSTTQKGFDGG